jgi:hypothetical protein
MAIDLGFGCFFFGYDEEAEAPATYGEYARNLQTFLESLANVGDLELADYPSSGELRLVVHEAAYGPIATPLLARARLSFEIVIPERIQKRVSPSGWGCDAERFLVTIDHAYNLPLTMVAIPGAANGRDGSTAVVVVREFLRNELEKGRDQALCLRVLGPSPAHVRVRLSAAEDDEDGPPFELTKHVRVGYDLLDYRYDGELFNSDEFASRAFFEVAATELDTLYRSAEWAHEIMGLGTDISSAVQDIVSEQRTKGFRSWPRRTFGQRRALNDIFMDLADYEAKRTSHEQWFRSQMRDLYDAPTPTLLEPLLRQEGERPDPNFQHYRELLSFLEARQLTDRELVMVIVSALVGGAAGAALPL